MITVNENIINMLNAPARRIKARVELYNCSALLPSGGYNRELVNTFNGDDGLIDFKIDRMADDGKFFGFGISQKLTVQLRDTDRTIAIGKGQILEVSFGVESDYTYPFPLFRVEEVSRDENNNNLTVIAYDFLYKANEHRVNEITLRPYTIRSFIVACANALNLPVKIDVKDAVFDTLYPEGANFEGSETFREAFNAVAEATQTIFFVDWDWRLTFRRLNKDAEPVLHIDRSKYFTLTNKTDRTLTTICHATELGDNVVASSGETGVTQYVRNNPFWDLRDDIGDILNNAVTAIAGTTISQFDCTWRGNFTLEIGDKVSIATKNGDTLTTYVLNNSLHYNGGLREQMNWAFTEHNAETANNPVNLGDALRQTYARVNKAEKTIELAVKETQEFEDRIEETVSSLTLSTDGIASNVSRLEEKVDGDRADLETQIQQNADAITSTASKVEVLEGTTETIESQIKQTADAIELKVSKDEVIAAINLSNEEISISADKINLEGYATFADLEGNGTTTINGSNITTGTIDAERLNLTGAIAFGDLDSAAQTKINNIDSTATNAYWLALEASSSSSVPDYIKSTYIDATEIRSPTITGNDIKVYNTFQTLAQLGDTSFITGYVGAARGLTDDNETTYGVALASDWSANTYDVADNYVIVTNGGVRMESGDNNIYITPVGAWIRTTNDGGIFINNTNIAKFFSLITGNSPISDYIVEQGTSGIWTYRKWNSGTAECWGKAAVTTKINTAWGALYSSGALAGSDVDFPFTFAVTPVVNVSTYPGGTAAFVMATGYGYPASTTSTGRYELVRGTANATDTSYGLNYHVIGKWK